MTWNSQTPRRQAQKGLLGGVCAGVAEQFGLNPQGVRVAVVICALCATTITALSYGIAWILMREG